MNNRKVLFTANKSSDLQDFLPHIVFLKENGYEVHTVNSDAKSVPYVDKCFNIELEVSNFSMTNLSLLKSVKFLKELLDIQKYDLIHTHTTSASIITRMAAKNTRKVNNTILVYTAYGFDYSSLSSKVAWSVSYPLDKLLEKEVDTLVTVNSEDYNLATEKFNIGDIRYISGTGIKQDKLMDSIVKISKKQLLKDLVLTDKDTVVLCIDNYTKDNNQQMIIRAMEHICKKDRNVKILLVGKDKQNGELQGLARELDIINSIRFIDDEDVDKYYAIADIYVDSSINHGFSKNLVKAVLLKKPIVASNARSNVDIIKNQENGFLVTSNDHLQMSKYIGSLIENFSIRENFSKVQDTRIQKYLFDNVKTSWYEVFTD